MTLRAIIQTADHRRRVLDVLARMKVPRDLIGEAWLILAQAPMGLPASHYAMLVRGRLVDHKRKVGNYARSGRVRFRQAPDWVFGRIEAPAYDTPRIDTHCLDAREYLVARLLAAGNTLVSGAVSLGLCPSGLHKARAGLRQKVGSA